MNIEEKKISNETKIQLSDLLSLIYEGKIFIFASTLFILLVSVLYVRTLPDVYKSEVTLIPADENNSMNISGQLGGLAALAGVSFGSKTGDKTVTALEILKSKQFLKKFIEDNHLMLPIMAAKGWDDLNDKLIIDPQIYDEKNNKWLIKHGEQQRPSIIETITKFNEKLIIFQDKNTGVIKISIEFYSPVLAKQWLDMLVESINSELRQRDLIETENSINYLLEQIDKTNKSSIKQMMNSLVEEQSKKLMLANVREEYVFKTIDSAMIPDKASGPKRTLIILVLLLLGFVISSIIVLITKLRRY